MKWLLVWLKPWVTCGTMIDGKKYMLVAYSCEAYEFLLSQPCVESVRIIDTPDELDEEPVFKFDKNTQVVSTRNPRFNLLLRAELARVLQENQYNKQKTARVLGMNRKALYRMMERLQVDCPKGKVIHG